MTLSNKNLETCLLYEKGNETEKHGMKLKKKRE